MEDYYILLRLSRKDYKIMNLKEEKGRIEVELESRKNKVRCPECNYFTSSVHSKLKPIKSKYLDSCEEPVELIIHKRVNQCNLSNN